jgi:hypothetical protein
MKAVGSSMFPWIPSGSTLELEPFDAASARAGDILVFIGDAAELVAHRVVAVETAAHEPVFIMRGDAQEHLDRIAAGAVAYRVTRVSYGGFSYATRGCLGRAVAHFAVPRAWPFCVVQRVAGQLVVAHRYLRGLLAQSL